MRKIYLVFLSKEETMKEGISRFYYKFKQK